MSKWIVGMAVALGATTMVAPDAAQVPDAYLRSTIGLSASNVKRIRSGQAVATLLDGRDGREVVTFGAVRIDRPPDDVLEYLTRVDALRQGDAVQQAGVLQTPPRAEDFASFTLPPRSVASLQSCRVGDCELQLPAWAITRLQEEVPWRTPDADARAHAVIRDVAYQTLATYLRDGHTALAPYEDRRPPQSASDDYATLLESKAYLPAPLTALRHALSGFPRRTARGVHHQFFWTVLDFGMKPTFRLSHMAVASGPAIDDPDGQVAGTVATVQILATHYFSSTLEWHFIVRDRENPSGTYLYYLARSWAPGLGGLRGRLLRTTVRNRGRDAIETYLVHSKRTLQELAGR